jgi:SAM-dependent methyltransferase
MNPDKLHLLRCPACGGELELTRVERQSGNVIAEGMLGCSKCNTNYPIVRYIPRFVARDNYARSFGVEWAIHARTQYDSQTGSSISEDRFYEQTGWPRQLDGQIVLEVGCGGGRFTEHAGETGATVVSLDLSNAVEANHKFNGHRDNLLIVQADVYAMPVMPGSFDRVFCFGMLQHTPDPRKAFNELVRFLKTGGSLAVDVYPNKWYYYFAPKKWLRMITKHIPPEKLYPVCRGWVNLMWPVVRQIRKLPGGRMFNRAVLVVADYHGIYDVPDETLKEFAILDTFDCLSPYYEKRQRTENVRDWFEKAGSSQIEVLYRGCVVQGRGLKN